MQSIAPQQLLEQFGQAWSKITASKSKLESSTVADSEVTEVETSKAIAKLQAAWAIISGPTAIQLYSLAFKAVAYLLLMLVYLLGTLFWLLSILLLTAATALNQKVNGAEGLPQFPLSEQDADAIATVRVQADEKFQVASAFVNEFRGQARGQLGGAIARLSRKEKSTANQIAVPVSNPELATVIEGEQPPLA